MIEINKMRNYLRSKVGSKIVVIYNGNRNKREKYVGVVGGVYRNLFIVILKNNTVKSVNYCDILTKTIQIYV